MLIRCALYIVIDVCIVLSTNVTKNNKLRYKLKINTIK